MFNNFVYFIKPLKISLFNSLGNSNDLLLRFISGVVHRAHFRQMAYVTGLAGMVCKTEAFKIWKFWLQSSSLLVLIKTPNWHLDFICFLKCTYMLYKFLCKAWTSTYRNSRILLILSFLRKRNFISSSPPHWHQQQYNL